MTLQCLFITFLLGFCCLSTGVCVPKPKEGANFEYLQLAQFWPTSSAIYFQNQHKHWSIPQGVDGWTIHGLWPSIRGSHKLRNCNNSMKFHFNEIEVLSKILAVKWPDYCTDEGKRALWDHEWTEHGTCAYSLPILKGELRYFNQTLNLHSTLNTKSVLSDNGIVPSKKLKYTVGKIVNALKQGYGKIPDITCIYDEENHTYHLEQIRLCFNKQLEMMDCPDVTYPRSTGTSTIHFESTKQQDPSIFIRSNFEDCLNHRKVYYYPIPRKH